MKVGDSDKEVAIGRWVSNIRGAYKKYGRDGNCSGKTHISPHEIKRLEVSMIIQCLVSSMYILNPLNFLSNLVLLPVCAKSIKFNFKYQSTENESAADLSMQNLEALALFKKTYKHMNVPVDHKLHKWIKHVRKLKATNNLDEIYITILNELNFEWK